MKMKFIKKRKDKNFHSYYFEKDDKKITYMESYWGTGVEVDFSVRNKGFRSLLPVSNKLKRSFLLEVQEIMKTGIQHKRT
jgi:uncharacterized protein YbcV (DUF1398 family)